MRLLADSLLTGRRIALAGSAAPALGPALAALGAELERLELAELAASEEPTGEWARGRGRLDALVHAATGAFGGGGRAGLRAALDEAWTAVRELAVGGLLERHGPGKIVLIGPRPDAGPLAGAARAGLENLARTLSVEWARYGVTAVMLAPGAATGDAEIAQLVAFLVSEAGEYFSGCRIELGGVRR
jgi:NAD(P)-dependent dehydrogenase (short-subunit alcohol dehydrogenase family)